MACALAVGLENLEAGNAGIIDHLYSPLAPESMYGVAEAYESLGVMVRTEMATMIQP